MVLKNKNVLAELGYSEKTSVVVKIVVGIEIVMFVAKEQHTPASINVALVQYGKANHHQTNQEF